jgi:membrane protease YdiL (CAAX protease family)
MMAEKLSDPFIKAVSISIGLWVFALLYRGSFPMQVIAALSLLATAILIVQVILSTGKVLWEKSIWQWQTGSGKVYAFSIMVSVFLALCYRYSEQMPIIPASAAWFVVISILIGATEELIFRGVVQGEAGRWNMNGAIYLSAFAFAGYKSLLFVLPSAENQSNILILFILTFLAGIVLGYARKNSGSILPCLVAHGIFDILVYMETANPPWWVW